MSTGVRTAHRRAPHALARAAAATAVIVPGATAAHTWAGGSVPTAPGLVLVTAVVFAGGVLLFSRDVTLRLLLPAVAAAQLGLHESFGPATGHTQHAAPATGSGGAWQMVAAHAGVVLLTAALWWAGHRFASLRVSFPERPTSVVLGRVRAFRARALPGAVREGLLSSPRRGPPLAVRPT